MAKKTDADPTGLRDKRLSSTKRLQKKLKDAQKGIRELVKNLSFTKSSERLNSGVLAVIYNYKLTPDETQSLYQTVRDIINTTLLETRAAVLMPLAWWWKKEIEHPYRKGTVEQLDAFNKLLDDAVKAGVVLQAIPVQSIPADLVLTSPAYLSGLNNAYIKNYEQIKSLSDQTAMRVIQQLNDGIAAGLSRQQIAENIAEQFEISYSNAKRIADTEINAAYNNAKLKAIDDLATSRGLIGKVMHISALSPTTRESHADRHNRLYSTNEQLRWWNSGSNRIYCKCTVASVLLDNQGNVISQELNRQIRE